MLPYRRSCVPLSWGCPVPRPWDSRILCAQVHCGQPVEISCSENRVLPSGHKQRKATSLKNLDCEKGYIWKVGKGLQVLLELLS